MVLSTMYRYNKMHTVIIVYATDDFQKSRKMRIFLEKKMRKKSAAPTISNFDVFFSDD